jgi:leucyl aminopeptidase (aminopeptidase T)
MPSEEAGPVQVAQSLLGTAVGLKRDENVLIETWTHTLSYAAACVVEARRLGAHPLLLFEDETTYWRSIDAAPQLARWARVGGHEWAALAQSDAYVFFPGPADMPRLRAMPTERYGQLVGYNAEWYKRARLAKLRAVRCILGYAAEPQAQAWNVSAATWRSQLIQAMVEADPKAVRAAGQRAARKLAKGKVLRITATNGTDLTLKLRGRRPWIDDGQVDAEDVRLGHNVTVSPPGSVAVAVDEHSAEGVAVANRPTYTFYGRLEGGQWELREGRLANSWYTDGQPAFEERYERAPKGKEVLSVFSLGLNPSLGGGVPQVEDQEAGAVTLGIGGNASYGGSNRCPFFAWIVVGEATVAVDGVPLCDRGLLL